MVRNVVFAAPFPAEVTHRFARAARSLPDVRLLGLVHTAPNEGLYHDIATVSDPLSGPALAEGIESLRQRYGPVERVVGILEAIQVQLAEIRAGFGIPGTPPEVARVFRDKSAMKAALSRAGLPVARSQVVSTIQAGLAQAEALGFPLVLKPPTGMGSKSTFRVKSAGELEAALRSLGVSAERPVLVEEFLTGTEYSLETITTGGEVRLVSMSKYAPNCLEALENPWVQWCCHLPRDLSTPEFANAEELGRRAVKALGLHQGVTHMEWFRRSDGSLAIGEIALRPPGANISLMTGLAHGMDMYRAWARAEIDGDFDGPYTRSRAVGCAFLRGMGTGRVASVHGVRTTHERVGHLVAEAQLPRIGAPKNDSYEGDGYVVVAHQDTKVVKDALRTIIDTVRVGYVR